ncbi:MAG: HAD-IIIA family hydrolase [Gemmatimonadetes bacterium]|nr:HAD-IIIA family hydrolase [Gemmatimonadota bacterium]
MKRAAFLDRDGTIIVEQEYLADPAGVELLPGAAAALGALRDCGYSLVVVTNQSGIARGLYTEDDFLAVQGRLASLLAEEGVRLDGVYMCPHHPAITGPCECRKPGLALYRQAAETLGVELSKSVWIGDRAHDVEPALRLGGRGWLVRTGYGRSHESDLAGGLHVAEDITSAALAICEG